MILNNTTMIEFILTITISFVLFGGIFFLLEKMRKLREELELHMKEIEIYIKELKGVSQND